MIMYYYLFKIDHIKIDFGNRIEIIRKSNERKKIHENNERELKKLKGKTEEEIKKQEELRKKAEKDIERINGEISRLLEELSRPVVVKKKRRCSIM